MSRCFPFPPPRYEKKARITEEDLLKKEKRIEEKQRREKKEKEKGDNEGKKERDKKKKKDKKKEGERDNDKARASDESRLPSGEGDNDKASASDESIITNETNSHNRQNPLHRSYKDNVNSVLAQKKYVGHLANCTLEKLNQNGSVSAETRDSKFVQELGRRIRDEECNTRNLLVENSSVVQPKRGVGMVKLVPNRPDNSSEGKARNRNKNVGDMDRDGQVNRGDIKLNGYATLQTWVGGMFRPLENANRRMESKEKIRDTEVEGKGEFQHSNKVKKEKIKGNNRSKEDENRRKEKGKKKISQTTSELEKLKERNEDKLLGVHYNKTSFLPKNSEGAAALEGNIKKRKSPETDGAFHNSSSSSSLQPTSSHPHLGNGQKLKLLQHCTSSSDRQGSLKIVKLDGKERKINGSIEVHPATSQVAPLQASQFAATKPPHPDSKFLNELYSVPKLEEWPELSDEDWLCNGSSSGSHSKKTKRKPSEVKETPQVLADAVEIKSADIYALPYVVRF